MKIAWIIIHFLPTLGFILALLLMVRLIKEQRSPSSTLAWLLAIFLVPYIGVPLYVLIGGRKMKRMAARKENLSAPECPATETVIEPGREKTDKTDALLPVRKSNRVTWLETGEDVYRYLIDSIENARKSIHITTFILGRDDTGESIIRTLTRKAEEGIEVCLLLDALGSFHITDHHLSDFKAAGGKYAFFMPMIHLPFRGRANLRNHRKMALIDHTTAITGGMNLAHEYMGPSPDPGRWRDISLAVEGPVVQDFYTVFQSDWKFAAKEDLPLFPDNPVCGEVTGGVSLQLVPSGPDVDGDPLYDTIITHMFTAQKRIWIVTPYFIPDEILVKALSVAARRGVDVRVVVPKTSNHLLADLVREGYLRQIQASGTTVFKFVPVMMHGKLVIIDDSLGIIGSANMDLRSFFLNYEIALFIYSEDIVRLLDSWAHGLMKESETGVKGPKGITGVFEGFARLLAPLL
ncbi:phospholipase D-like domain-containing protein [bacterium]|nr:phospholipase D-like domain-containing protein [bacterium]